MPEREVAAAATTASQDVRPESSRRRRRRWPLERLAPGPLVSRTRARVEEQRRRQARLGSASRPPRAPRCLFVPALGAAALGPAPRPGPLAARERAAAARIAACGGRRGGRGSRPALSACRPSRGRSGAGSS